MQKYLEVAYVAFLPKISCLCGLVPHKIATKLRDIDLETMQKILLCVTQTCREEMKNK